MIEVIPFPHDEHGEFLYVGRFCSSSDVIAAGGSGTNDLKIINRKTEKVRECICYMGGESQVRRFIYMTDCTHSFE